MCAAAAVKRYEGFADRFECCSVAVLLLRSVDGLGNPAVAPCSAGAGDQQLAALVHTLSAQVAGLRIGRHFSIRDVIKWAHRMQVRLLFCLDVWPAAGG